MSESEVAWCFADVSDGPPPPSLQKAFAALCHSTHLYGRRLVLEWADAEDTVETLRRKTAEHYHGNTTSAPIPLNPPTHKHTHKTFTSYTI